MLNYLYNLTPNHNFAEVQFMLQLYNKHNGKFMKFIWKIQAGDNEQLLP